MFNIMGCNSLLFIPKFISRFILLYEKIVVDVCTCFLIKLCYKFRSLLKHGNS